MTGQDGRVAWLDAAKGMAIVLVVWGHALRGVRAAQIPVPESFFNLADAAVYSFHIPLFLLLSGLLAAGSIHRRGSAALPDRARSILLPYAVWSTIFVCANLALGGAANDPLRLADLAAIPWRPVSIYWFFWVLFACHCLAAAVRPLGRVGTVATTLALSSAFFTLAPPYPLGAFCLFQVFFMAGLLLAPVLPRLSAAHGRTGTAALALTGAAGVLAVALLLTRGASGYVETGHDYSPWFLLAPLPGMLLAWGLARLTEGGRLGALLQYLGRRSLPIYVAHILFTAGARIVLKKLLHTDALWPHLAFGTLLGLAGPLLLHAALARLGLSILYGERQR